MEDIKINRKIELNQQFRISRMKEGIKPTKPHKHDGYFEIIYLTGGAGVHVIDENDYQVEPPMPFCMSLGHVHCWDFSKLPKGFVCIFKEEFLNDFPDIKLKFSEFTTKYNLQGKGNRFDTEFDLMQEEYEKASPNLNILRSYLNIILWKIFDLPVNSNKQHHTINPTLVSYRKLIDTNYTTEKKLDFCANKIQVSKRVLKNICKKETGRSASSLINEHIIVESKRLLKYTDNSISEVAYHLNFTDPSHFVKFFKNKTNLTPGEFRGKLYN